MISVPLATDFASCLGNPWPTSQSNCHILVSYTPAMHPAWSPAARGNRHRVDVTQVPMLARPAPTPPGAQILAVTCACRRCHLWLPPAAAAVPLPWLALIHSCHCFILTGSGSSRHSIPSWRPRLGGARCASSPRGTRRAQPPSAPALHACPASAAGCTAASPGSNFCSFAVSADGNVKPCLSRQPQTQPGNARQ